MAASTILASLNAEIVDGKGEPVEIEVQMNSFVLNRLDFAIHVLVTHWLACFAHAHVFVFLVYVTKWASFHALVGLWW